MSSRLLIDSNKLQVYYIQMIHFLFTFYLNVKLMTKIFYLGSLEVIHLLKYAHKIYLLKNEGVFMSSWDLNP